MPSVHAVTTIGMASQNAVIGSHAVRSTSSCDRYERSVGRSQCSASLEGTNRVSDDAGMESTLYDIHQVKR